MTSNSKEALGSFKKYYCEICDYYTNKKSNHDKHCASTKHSKALIIKQKEAESSQSSHNFQCKNCDKEYKDYSGLWRHKKKCITISQPIEEPVIAKEEEDQPTEKQIMLMLIKENTELKNMMMELLKNGTHNTTNNTNSHNKTFNLQFFLNETCKDAMNIMDFVESIQLQISDLEKVGEIGYVDGISQIIVQNLKAMDITQRPLHCTDKKREVLYLKDEDKWEKQGEDNAKLRKVIHKVSDKNIRMISAYKEKHPDCNQSDSRYSDQYAHILIEAMGGPGDNRSEKEAKIIKNISKEVVVEKAPL